MSPFARFQVKRVQRQQFPPMLADKLHRIQNKIHLRIIHKKGEAKPRKARSQYLRFGILSIHPLEIFIRKPIILNQDFFVNFR